MTDQDKFEGFKEQLILENEKKYGKEIREKYSDEVIDASNEKLRKMTKQDHDRGTKLGIIILEKLKEGFETGNIKGSIGEEIYKLHKEWLMCYWPSYSAEGHKGLGDMYVQDERFKAYYDSEQEGLAKYLRDIIYAHAKK